MIQLVADQVEMSTLLDFNTSKQIEQLKKQAKLLTRCSQIKLLANQANTAKAIAKAEMILNTKETRAAKTKAFAAGVVAARQNSYDDVPELFRAAFIGNASKAQKIKANTR